MQIIRMAPNTTVSQPSKVARAWGRAVSSTAPTREPYTEAMPPITTMVTSSMEWKKSARLGVTKPT